jgi:hypothetical protein
VSGCLGAVVGFVVVLVLASLLPADTQLPNWLPRWVADIGDGWLIIGVVAGSITGKIAAMMVGDVLNRRREASIPITSKAGLPEASIGGPGTVTLSRVPIRADESGAVRRLEISAFGFTLGLAAIGAAVASFGQVGWGIALGLFAVVSAIVGLWRWIQARDKWTIWAVGTIGLSARRDYASRDWSRVCTILVSEKSLDFDCDVYDRLAPISSPNQNKLLQFDGAVQFLPGSDIVLRIEAPVGTVMYQR